MRTNALTVAAVIVALSGCTPAVDVEQERAALARTDSEWAAAAADPDKFASFCFRHTVTDLPFSTPAAVASVYMPVV